MKKNYVYLWHDQLISHEINPSSADLNLLKDEDAGRIKVQLLEKNQHVLRAMKEQYFRYREAAETRDFLKKHYDELVTLIGKVHRYSNLVAEPVSETVADLYDFVSDKLGSMLLVFEADYAKLLPGDVLVPISRLIPARDEILSNMEMIVKNLSSGAHGLDPIYIVREMLDDFISKVNDHQPVTLHEYNYTMYVVSDVKRLSGNEKQMSSCPPLHELLIKWNLNSKTAIAYFTNGIQQIMTDLQLPDKVMEFLEWEYKNLGQMPEEKGYIYNASYPSLRDYCMKWISVEKDYRKRNEGFLPLPERKEPEPLDPLEYKTSLALSGDQVALMIRAAYDMKLLAAKSMRALFKAIVPHLSTPSAEHPSWEAMRAKSYDGEVPDKELVIQKLEEMIKRIKAY